MLCSMCGRDTAHSPGGLCTACGAMASGAAASATRVSARAVLDDATAPTIMTSRASGAAAPALTPPPHEGQHAYRGPLIPGASFGMRYRIIRLLGTGGMGAVYHAWDDELGEAVALKVIRLAEPEDRQAARGLERRFKRELVLARQITHKNVVRIHDLGEIDGIKYLTMPYIQGSDLAAFLQREDRVPVGRALAIARQIAAGLRAAHDAGVVHRDLKPANVMLDADDHAVIMDFGIARSIAGAPGGTVAGAVVGTLEYMAPEQALAQEVDHRADIYAFGLILYDMLVGRRPSSRAESAVAELMDRIQRPLAALRTIDSSIPEPLDALVARCVHPDPASRFHTTAELVAALDALDATGQRAGAQPGSQFQWPTPAAEPRPVEKAPMRVMPLARWWAAAAVAVALLAVIGGLALWRSRSAATHPSAMPPAAAPATSLAILPFRNATGDAALDWIGASLASMTHAAVGGSSIRVVPTDRLYQILGDLRVSLDVEPHEGTLRRLAEFSSAEHVLTGRYVRMGSGFRVEGALRTIKTSAVTDVSAEAGDQAELARAVTSLAAGIRRHLAGGTAAHDAPEAVAPSTRSIQALRAFTEGQELRRRGNHLEALKRFEQAVAEDSGFALAFSKLGETYASLGQDTDAVQASREAVQRADQLPPREKYHVLAVHAGLTNDTGKAVEAYEHLAQLAPGDSQVLFDLAALYEGAGDYDRAQRRLLDVLKLDPQFSNALFALGRVEIRRRNPDAALEPLNRALSLAIQNDNTELKGTVLNAIGIAYKRLGKPDEAVRYYGEALDIRRTIGDRRGIAASLNELGQVRVQLQRPREALANFEESLKIRRELNDRRGTGTVLLDLGLLYSERGEHARALALFKESLQIQLEVGDESYQGHCLNNIGRVHLLQARYDEALTYFERALHIWERLDQPSLVSDTVHNIAETLVHVGQYDRALSQFLRALEMRRTAGDRQGGAIESFSMGTVFELQGRYAAALDARQEAVKAFREFNDAPWLCEMLIGHGNTLALMGRSEEARTVIDESLALARRIGQPRLTAMALNAQGNSFFYQGRFKDARPSFAEARRVANTAADPDVALAARLSAAKLDVKEGRARAAGSALRAVAQQAEKMRLRAVAAEASLYLGEALLATKRFAAARMELEAAVDRTTALGLRPLAARSHYLLSEALSGSGDSAGAARHALQARQIVDAVRAESRTDDLLTRDDLRPIRAGAAPAL